MTTPSTLGTRQMAQADIDRMEDRVGRPPESIVRRPTAVISQVAWLAAQEGMVVYDDEDEHEQDAASMVRKSRGSMRVSRHVSRFSRAGNALMCSYARVNR